MKAENITTGHNRTIRFTGLPTVHPKDFTELSVVINYKAGGHVGVRADGSDDYAGDGEKAVCLDGVIIPRLIEAFNKVFSGFELHHDETSDHQA